RGRVFVTAKKDMAYGQAEGIADDYYAAEVNVTLCQPPSKPTLQDVPDSHNRTIMFFWTSGQDPNNLPTYDIFSIDGNQSQISPPIQIELSFGPHTWSVRTCNQLCCSDWATDSFLLFNNPPSKPVLYGQNHTNQQYVILRWESGSDPDNDRTYDEYTFNGSIKSPASPPQIEQNLSDFALYVWGARTCDVYGACSEWAYDDFIKFTCLPCPPCPPCPPCRAPGAPCPPCPRPCVENWTCEEWGPCLEPGIQFRECIDVNQCNTTCTMPSLWQNCTPLKVEVETPKVEWILILWIFVILAFLMAITLLSYLIIKQK
ncbi:MAG: hypothetical protein QXG26_02875, partial [Candidatus Aenigmatarchaeota archaeon]